MKYDIVGIQRFVKGITTQVVDSFDNKDDAEKEIRKMRIEHPSWVFWLSEKYEDGTNEKIQSSVRTEPKL
jgi:hypothetical protein